jgi:hypothetical protein
MINENNYTLSTRINPQNFILENLFKCENTEIIEFDSIVIDNFTTVQKLFENLNFSKVKKLNCSFIVGGNFIRIQLINEEVYLYLSELNSPTIKDFLNNLPSTINYIYIEHPMSTEDILSEAFTNLPVNLKKIEIEIKNIIPYIFSNNETVKKMEEEGKFNFLFGAKLPFGCEMILHINHLNGLIQTLNVEYENNKENELTLNEIDFSEEKAKKIIIKQIIIKYVANLYMYKTNYNILRIMSGMSGLAYSN